MKKLTLSMPCPICIEIIPNEFSKTTQICKKEFRNPSKHEIRNLCKTCNGSGRKILYESSWDDKQLPELISIKDFVLTLCDEAKGHGEGK